MAFDILNALHNDLEEAKQRRDNVPNEIDMMRIRKVNNAHNDAAQRPNPEPLWLTLWYEGEVCCLFADSNVGKSIYAMQIAAHIAEKHRVMLVDFELSDKQSQLRYTDENGVIYQFPSELYRVELNPDKMDTTNFEDAVMKNIEDVAVMTDSHILIIDNLTYLCKASEKGDAAGQLMMRLMQLKRKHSLSILVLAHTPKRNLSSPITQNDLAGSKKLFNFFDSAFSIGKSGKDPNLRYIKQVKVRNGSFDYDCNNVIVCSIEKNGSFLGFITIGYAEESEHLKEFSPDDKQSIIDKVKSLHAQGMSIRQIAAEVGISHVSVSNYLKK